MSIIETQNFYNEEAEQNVLGSIFLSEQSIKDVSLLLNKNDFFIEQHKYIFDAMKKVFDSGLKVDYTTVYNQLTKDNTTKEGDGMLDYILNLANSVPSARNVMNYAKIVLEWSQKRHSMNRLIELTNKYKTLDVEEIEQELKNITLSFNDGKNAEDLDGFVNLYDCFDDYIDFLEKPIDTERQFKFGFHNFDRMVMLEPTNLMIIGADTGVGKTAFALNIVNNFCKQDKNVFFVSQEMGRKEVLRRMIALIGEVNAQNLKRKELTDEEWKRVMFAKEQTKKYKLNVYDKGNMSIEMLYTIVSRLKKQDKIDVLVVDYLQLIEVKRNKGNRANEVAYVSRKMKQIGMEFDIPVILLSQLNRNISSADGTTRKPVKSDLKESSSIEQDANIIVLLHTKDTKQQFQKIRYIDLFIAKQRDGVLGETHFSYIGDNVKFVETEWNDDEKRFINTPEVILGQDDVVIPKSTIDINEDDLPF